MIKRLGAFFIDILQVVVFAVAIFLFIYLLILQPHKIKGESMYPSFLDGEFLLTDKVTYRFREPARGDVIVFKAPVNENDEYIKRIIGIPGDKVVVKNGFVYLNGTMLTETYLAKGTFSASGRFIKEGEEYTVPAGSYFVLGDNRSHSSDSRAWGFVTKAEITGRAWLVYWPPEKAGTIPTVTF